MIAKILQSTNFCPSSVLQRDIVQHHENLLQLFAQFRDSTRVVAITSECGVNCECKYQALHLLEASIFGLNSTPVADDDVQESLKYGKEVELSLLLQECSKSVDLRYKRFNNQFKFILKQPRHSGLLTRDIDCIFYLLGDPKTVLDWKQVKREMDVLLNNMDPQQTLAILVTGKVEEVGSRPFELLVDVWRQICCERGTLRLETTMSWRLWCLIEDQTGELINVREMLEFACQYAEEDSLA